MSGGRPGSSPAEAELWRLLSHARSCDGLKLADSGKLVPCPTCKHIDRWLEDGSTYFADDPVLRMKAVDTALENVTRQADRLAKFLESSSLPASSRAVAVQVVEWLVKTRTLLTLPITDIPGYTPPPQRVRRREGPVASSGRDQA